MNDLAQTFGAKISQLAIDGHAPPHVNRAERGIFNSVNLILFIFNFVSALFPRLLIPVIRFRLRQHFNFVRFV